VRLLFLHQHPAGRELDVRGIAHPPAVFGAGALSLASGTEHLHEIGWQRPNFSLDTWTWEMRRSSIKRSTSGTVLQPTLDRSLHVRKPARLRVFANAKFSYDVTKKVALGMEYYASYGP